MLTTKGNDMIATIGYEKSTLEDFIATLKISGVDTLIDIRDRAQSRRAGFSKTALSEALSDSGISYFHFKALGDPKEGREAARAGDFPRFKEVFNGVMASSEAKESLEQIKKLALSNNICLMCYERDQRHCHRKIVSDKLETMLGCKSKHLGVRKSSAQTSAKKRMLHTDQSAAA